MPVMPNCDFYAINEDVIALGDFIFGNTDCKIYDTAYAPHVGPHCFMTTKELYEGYTRGFDGRGGLFAHMYSPAMRGELLVERNDTEANRGKPAGWRYDVHGWGLIQLYLDGIHDCRIRVSHTNHNTEKRVLAREEVYKYRLGLASAWDWKAITAISSKINRFIRKISPSKSGSLPIMPAAYKLVSEGKLGLAPR
jgi:hypothetical protein